MVFKFNFKCCVISFNTRHNQLSGFDVAADVDVDVVHKGIFKCKIFSRFIVHVYLDLFS